MSNPYVRALAVLKDFDGRPVAVGVDYDTVTIGDHRWSLDQMPALTEALGRAVHAAVQHRIENN